MFELKAEQIRFAHYNERDVETPATIGFVAEQKEKHGSISLLDVGAHYAHATYAKPVREILGDNQYDGCDILDDPPTRALLNTYFVGNVVELPLQKYDVVISISVIEHCGMTTYKRDDIEAEQIQVVERMMRLSNKALFLTFPYGQRGVIEGQYSNIHEGLLSGFTMSWKNIKGWTAPVKTQFFYNELPRLPEPKPWIELTKEQASQMPMGKCFCLFQAEA